MGRRCNEIRDNTVGQQLLHEIASGFSARFHRKASDIFCSLQDSAEVLLILYT